MPLTNLLMPGGYVGPGSVNYPVSSTPNGAVYYVNSATGFDNPGRISRQGTPATVTAGTSIQGPFGDPGKPLASVFGANGALKYCLANRGDLIVVMPGHTENITGVIPNAIPSGVSILGLGYGANRPTFTFTTATTANIPIVNPGIQIQNCIFVLSGFAGVVSGFTVSADGFQLISCRIQQASATNQATTAITLNAGADDFDLVNSEIDSTAAAGAAQAILAGGAVNRTFLTNNFIHGDFSAACIVGTNTNKFVELDWEYNNFIQKNGTIKVWLNLGNADSGTIGYNQIQCGAGLGSLAGAATGATSATLVWLQNYLYFAKAGGPFSGILFPAAGTIP